jgi:hypothetical protein
VTALQLAAAAGVLLGLAAATLVWRLVPAQPDLDDALGRLGPHARRSLHAQHGAGPGDARQRLGRWAMRTLPSSIWGRPPGRELDLLGIPVDSFYGQKVSYALLLAVLPPVVTQTWSLAGLQVPVTVPLLASLGLAALGWVLPDLQVRSNAHAARVEFTRSVAAFVDMLAMARMAGEGANTAVTAAAGVGDSWVFDRLRTELAGRTRRGKEAWQVLAEVADDLDVPELGEVADLVREAGDAVAVYPQLRARAAALRASLLADSKKQANEATQRMRIPMATAGLAAFGLVAAPPILRLLQVT